MKRLILLIAILCSFAFISCSSSSGGGDEAPIITDFEFKSDPFSYSDISSADIGDVVYLTFVVYDEDKDAKSTIISIKDAATLADVEPETEIKMGSQTEKEEYYYTSFTPDTSGTFKFYIYVKDKSGNKSNILSQNLTVN